MATGITERERAIREKRAQVFDGMAAIMQKYDNGAVALSVEDRKAFDDREAELRDLDADLERHLTMRRLEEGKEQAAAERGETRDAMETREQAYGKAFTSYLRRGAQGLSNEQYGLLATGDATEFRAGAALSTQAAAGVDGSAGFLVPQDFWHNLQVAMKAYGGLQRLVRDIPTATGAPMPWPTTDPTGQVGKYVSENTQLTGSDLIEFGQGMMHAWFITSDVIKASLAIINDSAFDVDSFVRDRMAERIGRFVAAELHTGAGAVSSALTGIHTSLTAYNKANGTAGSPDAAPTGGYYVPANGETAYWLQFGTTATAVLANKRISWQSILNMISSVDPAYRQSGRCVFVMNDQTQAMLRGLTDAHARPLWVPDVQVGPSDGPVARIEGYPVVIDQNTASVSSSASTAGGLLFGDFQTAMLTRTVQQAGTLRLTERYADFLQVGYLGFIRMDALPNDLRAVVEYKTAAS